MIPQNIDFALPFNTSADAKSIESALRELSLPEVMMIAGGEVLVNNI